MKWTFDQLLEVWAYWVINKGAVPVTDVARWFQGEQVQAGECTNRKAGTDLLLSSPYFSILTDIYINDLTDIQREVLAVELGIVDLNGVKPNKFLGIKQPTYAKRLHDAKQAVMVKIDQGLRARKLERLLMYRLTRTSTLKSANIQLSELHTLTLYKR
ncbi:hypothetical protein L2750_14600 [Shewanella submarina]|uniref:Phage antitermination protein Q n=1 Tax=Shewanella submarina TaxID=2016376 RepID=A0ABV7G8L1_9GAMM|nr:hypothetical protein [Shewanella submarina]MCL1038361.1 hypothetical protein [Shewanella submarina]